MFEGKGVWDELERCWVATEEFVEGAEDEEVNTGLRGVGSAEILIEAAFSEGA